MTNGRFEANDSLLMCTMINRTFELMSQLRLFNVFAFSKHGLYCLKYRMLNPLNLPSIKIYLIEFVAVAILYECRGSLDGCGNLLLGRVDVANVL